MRRLRQTVLALSTAVALTGGIALLGAVPAGAVNTPQVTHSTAENDATRAALGLAGAGGEPLARWQRVSPSSSPQPHAWLAAGHNSTGASDLASDGRFRNPVAPTVGVGDNPVAVAVDAANGTVYVGNGIDNTMSVVNAATCNATVHSGCGQKPATVPVGPNPVDAVVDQATHTVYVVNVNSDTVSVLDANACNAHHPAGCAATPPTITVGTAPDGLAIDQATHTVYVANAGSNTVSVINAATCNASHHSGCTQTPPAIPVGPGPSVPALNTATDTVYVPNSGADTVSVINGAACNASHHSGCTQTPPTITVGPNPFAAAIDQAADTVYVTSAQLASATTLGSVFVINGATCNGTSHSGCGQSPPTVTVGSIPIGVIVDPASNDVIVVNEEDSSVSIFGAAACNATHTAGCRTPVRTLSVGHNPGYLDVNPATHTLYVANQNDNTVSVLDTLACTPRHLAGCRIAAPTTPVGLAPQGVAADTTTGTVYVANRTDANLSVINSATCNARNRSGCHRRWPTVAAGPFPKAVAVNQRTGTVYTANCNQDAGCIGDTVSVIDAATCNAHVTSGCGQAPATVMVGSGPGTLGVNPVTDTVYVANSRSGTVSVINGAACNGTSHTGCGAAPPTVKVGGAPGSVAIDQATDTIYVVNFAGRGKVSVINGATCNGTDHTGCATTPPSFTTNSPAYVAVGQATNTIYVANYNASYVSVINGATCNAADQSGCGHATAMTATSPTGDLAIDQRTGTVFADQSFYGSEVFVFDGARCNAHVTSGCHQLPAVVPVGGWPGDLAAIPATHTLYVTDNVDGEASFFCYSAASTSTTGRPRHPRCRRADPPSRPEQTASAADLVEDRHGNLAIASA